MVKVAAVQIGGGYLDTSKNVERAVSRLREAAENGAKILCLPELFNNPYFCCEEDNKYFGLAETVPGPTTNAIARLARETRTVIIATIFEEAMKGEYYDTAVILGPDGEIIGKYRKMSIPYIYGKGRGREKYYFKPGNLGFPVFGTPLGLRIGILICYDRHFPEAARALGLAGAEVVFVPTCTSGFTQDMWEIELRCMARTNVYYVCGVNKVGIDADGPPDRVHFGNSVIINPKGETISRAGDQEEVIYADVDLRMLEEERVNWPVYRDRRPDAYGSLVGR